MASATIKPFSRMPTVVILQSSDNFNGTAHTGTPAVESGVVTYPAQAGGGLFNLHDKPLKVLEAYYSGGGTLTIVRVAGTASPVTMSISAIADVKGMTLLPGESLGFSTSGATTPKILLVAQEINPAIGS